MLVLCCRQKTGWVRILYLSATMGILAGFPPAIRIGFAVWLLGVAVWAVSGGPRSKPLGTWAVGAGMGAFFVSLVAVKFGSTAIPFGLAQDLVVGIGFSILALILVREPREFRNRPLSIASTGLAEMSYSLYLTHLPVVFAISVFVFGGKQLLPGLIGYLLFAFWMAILLLIGALFYWLFERHSAAVRRAVQQTLIRNTVAQSSAST